jgi:predicted ester cyclase
LSLLGSVLLLALGCARKQAPATTPSASTPPPPAPSAPPPPGADVLARKYVSCWETFNRTAWGELASCYGEGSVSRWIDLGLPEERGKSAVVEKLKQGVKTAFPNAKVAPQLVLVNGLEVAATGVFSGTQTGPLATQTGVVSPSGKPFGQLVFGRARFDRDTNIVDESFLSDRASMLFQLGASKRPARRKNTLGLVDAPVVVEATGNEVERSNAEAVSLHWRAFASEDSTELALGLAEDVQVKDQLLAEDARGKAKALEATAELLRALGKIRVLCPTLWGAGPYVVSVCKIDASHDGPYRDLGPTGREVSFTIAEITRLEGGLAREIVRFADGAHLLLELGAVPSSAPRPDQVTTPGSGKVTP